MRFSLVGVCLVLAATLSQASPVNTTPIEVSNDFASISKRCCILCDNPYARCGSNDAVEKREAVETEEEALFGPEALTKRCCVNCDNNRCTRYVVPVRQWPEKRCCVNCDNAYARCGSGEKEKREAMGTLGEALFGVERA